MPLHLFQNRNLPGMVKRVLRHSVQHKVEIVPLSRNPLAQAGIRQGRNRLHQHIVRVLRMCDGLAPRSLTRVGNHGKIRCARKLDFLPPSRR
jgi:hypothetical protein